MAKKKQPNTIQRLLDRVDRFGEQQTDWLTEAYSKIDAECSALVLENSYWPHEPTEDECTSE